MPKKAKQTKTASKPSTKGKDVPTAVRELCLWFPETEERMSRGSPDFTARGKVFATFVVNHHGDGRMALWLNAPAGGQQLHSRRDSVVYFVPPYVGPKGWLGVDLVAAKGAGWQHVATRVREAYEHVAPAALSRDLEASPKFAAPTRMPTAADIDPLQTPKRQKILAKLATHCLALPETTTGTQFGTPVWRAGKKTFASAYDHQGKLYFSFWVGAEQQGMLTYDKRFHIPAYTGHNGWISLNVDAHQDWQEIEALIDQSYRHFALKRMLKVIDEQ